MRRKGLRNSGLLHSSKYSLVNEKAPDDKTFTDPEYKYIHETMKYVAEQNGFEADK